ncbi:MAG TPA: hypothetical protein PKN50_08385, partial [Spirochaetota bacterium]|nr:hypothetical protein [Spirochaetota bacterium]
MQKKILDYIFNVSVKRGKLLLVIIAIITAILGLFIPKLIISSSQQNLIPQNDPEQARYIKYNKEFGSSENLIIILEGDSDHCKQVADDMAQELEKEKKWVTSVFYKIDTSVLIKRAPLYIPLEDLNKGVKILQSKKAWIDKIQNVSNLYDLLQAITVSFKEPNADISPDTAAKIIKFLNALFQEWNDWLANPNQQKLKIAQKLSMAGFTEMANLQSDGYLFSRDFNMMFFFVQPRNYVDEITYLKPFMTDISKACNRALQSHPDLKGKIKIAYTGMPAH